MISFSKKAKFEKIASRNYFSQKCTFQLAAKESFRCLQVGCLSLEVDCKLKNLKLKLLKVNVDMFYFSGSGAMFITQLGFQSILAF